MTENQRLLWLLSRSACAEVNQAMQEFTGVNYNTGEQNKDMTKARQVHDWKDTLTVLQYLQERNLFSTDSSLRSIATGVHAHSTVNVDTALAVWDMILTSMDGRTPAEYSFKRKNQAATLGMKSSNVKIDGDKIHIDTQLLFQRLTTDMQSSGELESVFKHELCSYPSASLIPLFCFGKQTNKPLLMLSGIFVKMMLPQTSKTLASSMSWMVGHFYNASHGLVDLHKEICHQYTEYVTRKQKCHSCV